MLEFELNTLLAEQQVNKLENMLDDLDIKYDIRREGFKRSLKIEEKYEWTKDDILSLGVLIGQALYIQV